MAMLSSFLEAKQTICLNMIVKNETPVIKRCLDSVKPLIDYWVIVDTGSTDGTPQMIREHLKDVPGELYERPWVNFEHNRNQALTLAASKGDYLLFIDADEYLAYAPGLKLPLLNKDIYYMMTSYEGIKYARVQLINNHLGWFWKGILHESIKPKPENDVRSSAGLKDFIVVSTSEGARSQDQKKAEKDAEVLEKALKDDPTNPRYTFYLARTYRGCGNDLLALKNFEKRVAMGGFDDEVYDSLLQIAILQEQFLTDKDQIVSFYQRAFQFRPSRKEPLYYLAGYLRRQKDFSYAYNIASMGKNIPSTHDTLFVQQWIYDYGMSLELSACAFWTGHYDECQKLSLELLQNPVVSPVNRLVVQNNLNAANTKLQAELHKD